MSSLKVRVWLVTLLLSTWSTSSTTGRHDGAASGQRDKSQQALPPFSDQTVLTEFQEFTHQYAFYHDLQDTERTSDFVTLEQLSSRLTQPSIQSRAPSAYRLRRRNAHISSSHVLIPPPGPDPTDRQTVVNLAKMTSDSYVFAPAQPGWLNTSMPFNWSSSFGWSTDGLRGHIFSDKYNKTVIISFKGTTVDPREKFYSNDRINDNLLFSCCCATQRPDPYPYGPVCGCKSDVYTCNETCLSQELMQKDRYYTVAMDLMMYNVSKIYPDAEYWAIGHSMGGAVASLIGLTMGLPVVTFEAPGDKLPATRLGLNTKATAPSAYHFGHTADPVYMGACNGWSSACGVAGYAFESQCFTGKRCVYDTVSDFGWHSSIANHRINTVIPEVLEKYNSTPKCEADTECVDCAMWKFNASANG